MAFGLARRDLVRRPSAYSELGLDRTRAKLTFSIGFEPMAVGLVGGLMIKREMVEYADMEMYASWRMEHYVCRSNKYILHCANGKWGLTKPTQEQIREMYLSTRDLCNIPFPQQPKPK